jgi:signal transduction histidine kinase
MPRFRYERGAFTVKHAQARALSRPMHSPMNLLVSTSDGMLEAIEHEVAAARAVGVTVHTYCDLSAPLPPTTAELAIEVTRVACRRLVRHSDARNAWLVLVVADNLEGYVRDNGVALHNERLDLMFMGDQVVASGGAFAVYPIDVGGTEVRFTLPLNS